MRRKTRRAFLGMVSVGSVAMIAGCSSESQNEENTSRTEDTADTSTPTITQTTTTGDTPTATVTSTERYPDAYYFDADSEIVLRDVAAEAGDFSISVTGEATNESEHDYDYVQLTFGLYDESDAKVGDALANTSGLASGQRWRFDAIGTGDNAATFQITDVTTY